MSGTPSLKMLRMWSGPTSMQIKLLRTESLEVEDVAASRLGDVR
jgi:hypothetical protein